MRLRMLVLTAAGSLALAGCAGGPAHRTGGSPEHTPAARSSPYSLYTHCGVDEANIDGRWYEASPPLSDGSGNPPKGWDNPYQRGRVTFVSETEVVFSDAAGHRVRFVLRPDASGPRNICS
jgi:hypothetical protein